MNKADAAIIEAIRVDIDALRDAQGDVASDIRSIQTRETGFADALRRGYDGWEKHENFINELKASEAARQDSKDRITFVIITLIGLCVAGLAIVGALHLGGGL
jgi:hypothetical protein